MYLDKLEADGLIEKNETGHLATYEGLFFKGYKKNKKKRNCPNKFTANIIIGYCYRNCISWPLCTLSIPP